MKIEKHQKRIETIQSEYFQQFNTGKISLEELEDLTGELAEQSYEFTDDDLAELEERAQCSVLFVMSSSRSLELKKVEDEFSNPDKQLSEYNRLIEILGSSGKRSREVVLRTVSISPKSFSHVILPKRHEKFRLILTEVIKCRGLDCELRFVDNKTPSNNDEKINWQNEFLPIEYPDYPEEIDAIMKEGEKIEIIPVSTHASRTYTDDIDGATKV